jgi:hypothetical protein
MARDRAYAWRRLLWALGASALLHWWFVQPSQQAGASRVTVAAGAPIIATLNAPPVNRPPAGTSPRAPTPERIVTHSAQAKPGAATVVAAPVAVERPADSRAAPSVSSAVLAQPNDPTYYAARDLDVFPKAITALNLDGRTGAAGRVRATVLIDESGAVNEVRAVEASAAEFENAARDLLLRTRFTPASKDGRIVKAQVLVNLDYAAP